MNRLRKIYWLVCVSEIWNYKAHFWSTDMIAYLSSKT
jgi:hypothetical protein